VCEISRHHAATEGRPLNARDRVTAVRLDREGYRSMHSRLAQACGRDADHPPMTEDEATAAFETDWESDSAGEGFVDKPKLLGRCWYGVDHRPSSSCVHP
jgi:hypothetical protein